MTARIKGSAPPPSGPKTEIYRVTSETKQTFIILSRSCLGKDIHWYGNRSHECTLDKGECDKCQRAWPRKWKGYLHCFHVQANAKVFLEITPSAFSLLCNLAPPNEDFRGLTMNVSKTKGGRKGRYVIEVQIGRRDTAQLPEEEDPLPILRYLWTCKNGIV